MAIQALVAEANVVALLDSRHLSYLGEFETRLLAALEFGYSVEAMVIGFHKSEAGCAFPTRSYSYPNLAAWLVYGNPLTNPKWKPNVCVCVRE